MGLIKSLKKSPGVGWCSKELSLAGFKHNSGDTRFVLEVLSLINKYELDNVNVNYYFDIIKDLHLSNPISELEDPLYNNEYLVHSENLWQSNRLGSLFSTDNGKTWYDINRSNLKIKFYRFIHKFWKVKKEKLLYYVEFPYNYKV